MELSVAARGRRYLHILQAASPIRPSESRPTGRGGTEKTSTPSSREVVISMAGDGRFRRQWLIQNYEARQARSSVAHAFNGGLFFSLESVL